MGIVHETGHALYEQNLPADYKNQQVGKAKGMAIHESQSLLMEMQIGRSKEFAKFLSKLLNDEFGLKGREYSADNLYKLNSTPFRHMGNKRGGMSGNRLPRIPYRKLK